MSESQGSWFRLPNCQDALRLVESGIQRPLNIRERISLRYHRRLCLYCSCNREKFDDLYRQMKEVEAGR